MGVTGGIFEQRRDLPVEQRRCLPQGSPGPGPVRLHRCTQLLHSHGLDYLASNIVHCPPNVRFDEPLLLDFLLDDPAVSSGKGILQRVLENYQVRAPREISMHVPYRGCL